MSLAKIGKEFAKMSLMIFITTVIFTALARMFRAIGRFLFNIIYYVYSLFRTKDYLQKRTHYKEGKQYSEEQINKLAYEMSLYYYSFGSYCSACEMNVPKETTCINCGSLITEAKKLLPKAL